MPRALVFGASGAIGRFLLPRLLAAGYDVVAGSRSARSSPGRRIEWLRGDLADTRPPSPPVDAILSAGPLDAFAQWFSVSRIEGAPRVVAFGSQSIESKADAADPAERALARRLRESEQRLFDAASQHGCACTVLRPTLIWGAGIDRSLTPLARFGMRWHAFPRIPGARGLRQPVHADDLANACLQVLDTPAAAGRAYALGGGERLSFDAMLERVRASLPGRTIPLPLPFPLLRVLAGTARRVGIAASGGALDRLTLDLVADDAPARAAFGWNPRTFRPTAADWMP